MKALLELRQRSKGYEPVQTEDDFELVPSQLSLKQDRINYDSYNDNHNDHNDDGDEKFHNEYIYNKPKKKESKLCMIYLFIIILFF